MTKTRRGRLLLLAALLCAALSARADGVGDVTVFHWWVSGGERAKAQPMIDSVRLCADFMAMDFVGVLWGKGGAPGAVEQDAEACQAAQRFFLA